MPEKFKFNKYSYFYSNGNNAILINFCNGAKFFFNNQDEIKFLTSIFNKKEIEFVDSNTFRNLVYNGFLLDCKVKEEDYVVSNYCLNDTNKLEFLIYVTNDCNFGCKYCPQSHNKTYIDYESMTEISNGIMASLLKSKNTKQLNISWFGGEPLLNYKNILLTSRKIMDFCLENDIKYNSGMTTNGYLLTKKTFISLYDCGIKEFQITIDGNENSHNMTRPLLNGANTWNVIIENLKDISSLDDSYKFNIIIRLNVSQNNIDEMTDFILFVSNNFDDRFSINVMPISKMGNETSDFHFCGKIEAQLVQIYLYKYMIDNNIDIRFLESMFNPSSFVCNSGRHNYFVINCEKKVFKCELNVNNDKYCIGYINNSGLYIDHYYNCSYSTPSTKSKCLLCKLYALCLGLACPLKKVYNEKCLLKDDYLLDDYMDVLLKYYEKKIKNL